MKHFLLSLVVLTVGMSSQAANYSKASHPLHTVKNAMMGHYFSGALPKGFHDRLVTNRPRLNSNLAGFLAKLEVEKQAQWKEYVLENDEEFGDLTKAERIAKANDPYGELGEDYLIEIQDVYEIFKNGRQIGYVFQTADHVQAAIYQDGAGIEIYTDTNQVVITTDEWAS